MTPADAWARRAFRVASPSTWLVMRLLAPAAGYRDFARVYAYFRVADDVVDAPGRDAAAVAAFVAAERAWLVTAAPEGPVARVALGLALRDRPALRGPVEGMWASLAFDAARGPGPLPAPVLDAQVRRIADAWLGAFAACLGFAPTPALGALVAAATATHHLRDLELDATLGYDNVPDDVPGDHADRAALAGWIAARAAALRPAFAAGLAEARRAPSWRARLLLGLLGRRYRALLDRMAPPGRASGDVVAG